MENSIQKLKDILSDPEMSSDMELIESPAVAAEMGKQWNAAGVPDAAASRSGENAWKSVSKRVRGSSDTRSIRLWRRYGVAASFLLLITIGAAMGLSARLMNQKPIVNYIHHSGNQDRVVVVLDDGTEVTLGARSRIIYPERFEGASRTIEMEGQAYFKVAHDADHPFVVKAGSVNVTALGTAFEVFEDEGRTFTEVILVEGKVMVDYPVTGSSDIASYILNPDQRLHYKIGSGTVEITAEAAVRSTAWKDQQGLVFIAESLSNILPRLEKWYGCRIICESPKALGERFTFRIYTESPHRIFENMAQTLPLTYNYDQESNTYTLSLLN